MNNKTVLNKKVVKYKNLDGEEVEAPVTLWVMRKNKNNKCKCHHVRISLVSGRCFFGKCRHEKDHHPEFKSLFNS